MQAWEVLEPGNDLHTNWLQEMICEYLTAVRLGQIKDLLINCPPRHLKSRIVSVAFPCWVWLHLPQRRFLCLSYATSLAIDHNYDRRRLIQSEWYQWLSGGLQLSFAKNRLSEFGNDTQGAMIARGYDGAVTGVGGDTMLHDDPNNPENVESDAERNSTLRKFKSYSTTRKNNPNAQNVVIQQRTHTDDVSGFVEKELNYEILKLPTEAEEHQVLYFPLSPGRSIVRELGDLLDGDRYGAEQVGEDKTTLGSYLWSARHQQRPIPIEGGMIKLFWFQRYVTPPSNPTRIIQSWDTASKGNDWNAPWVCGTWAEWEGKLYLLHVFRKRMDYPEGKRTVGNLALQWEPNEILIEDKSTGTNLLQELRDGIDDGERKRHFNLLPMTPDADKITRMSTESAAIEGGRVYLPETATWLPDYESEMSGFPIFPTKDQADMTSQLLKHIRMGARSVTQTAPLPTRPEQHSVRSLRDFF